MKSNLILLLIKNGKYDDEIKSMGGKIFYLPYLTDIGEKKYLKSLRDFFREHKEYKIVHSHLDQVSGIIMKAAYLENLPIRISHSHSTNNSNNILAKIYKRYLQSMIVKYGNNFFACSEKAGKWLFRKKSDECYIVKNGIDINKFEFSEKNRENIREKLNIKENEFVWGHIGRFAKVKNHEFLIRTFYEYQKKNKNSKLILIGAGPLENKIKEKIKKLGIEGKVIIIGSSNEPEKYYSAFDFVVFPSFYEGISLVLIEAQISGLPILASDRIDKNTNVTGTLKYMSLDKTPSEWAEYIETIDVRRKSDNKDKVRANGYDIKQVASNLIDKYNELLERAEK